MKLNPLLCTDFYKADHRSQYPEGTEYVYSNFTPRSSRHAQMSSMFDNRVVLFGLQAFVQEHLMNTWNDGFFNRPKDEVVEEYREFIEAALGEGAITFEHIEDLHDLGYLPIEVMALPEGSRVNIGVPMLTVENTVKEFFWLTNYLETWISNELWKTCTSATIAHDFRRVLEHWADKTGGSQEFIDVQCHDFSCRGMSGMTDAGLSGMGHLLSFIGTDTMQSIEFANGYYGGAVGVSVPATEHSVMCMGGETDELDTFKRLITELYPTGVVSVVSDTWDFWQVITEFTVKLKDEIMARQPNAIGLNKVVFRPDSGDPVDIICGLKCVDESSEVEYFEEMFDECDAFPAVLAGIHDESVGAVMVEGKYYKTEMMVDNFNAFDLDDDDYKQNALYVTSKELSKHEIDGAVQCLWDVFGGTTNDKGFKTLDQHVGLIYGDSITIERAEQIMQRLQYKGFASDNVVLGIGSYTYQHVTRDTFGFAMKATWGQVNGEPRMISKNPKTDPGKKSAKGRIVVQRNDGGLFMMDRLETVDEQLRCDDEMSRVFINSTMPTRCSFSDVKTNMDRY